MVTLPLFLLFILLPCSKSQDFLDQHQKWNYREGGRRSQWVPGFRWGPSDELPSPKSRKHSLNGVILLYYSRCSLRPVSAAVDNLVREVQSIRKRLEELNERLNVISKTVLPLRLNALQSQRRGNTQLRRLPTHRRRLYARRRPQST
ncbi:hypothetical protein RLOC_00007895 [Lonchura striata]|uniref:Uncharacterized protein n=1 Tax=Lonchura striata TaxID=40157 RepID=A0A218V088_9PASE|nr:hypothetical protein RLOC_00007895 [Lonchura striata domestica]